MEILKFKTNVDSDKGVEKLGTYLNKEESISRWQLDTNSPEHLLSVSGHEVDPQRVKNLVDKAGYKAEVLRVIGGGGGDL